MPILLKPPEHLHKMIPSRCEVCKKKMRRSFHYKLIAFLAGYAFALIWLLNSGASI